VDKSAPSGGGTAGSRVSLAEALRNAKGVSKYRVEFEMHGSGAFGLELGDTLPATATQGLPLISMWAEVNDNDTHTILKGVNAALLGVDPRKGLEMITVDGKAYVRGPLAMLDAKEEKWYEMPSERAQVAQPAVQPSSFFESFAGADMQAEDFTRTGSATLDGLNCDIYAGNKETVLKAFQNVRAMFNSDAEFSTTDEATLEFRVCEDGHVHQMSMSVAGTTKDKPDQTSTSSLTTHVFDIGADINIQAPPDAEPITFALPPTDASAEPTELAETATETPVATEEAVAPAVLPTQATCKLPELNEDTVVRRGRRLKSPTSSNTYIAYSPDGKILVSASSSFGSGTLVLWDIRTGRKLHEYSGSLFRPVFSRDGAMLAFTTGDASVVLWDAQAWEEIRTIENDSDEMMWSVAFSPDGKTLLTGDAGYRVKLWDVETGEKLKEFGDGNDIASTSLSFSPDGKRFVSGGQFISTKLWDVDSGEEMGTAEQFSFNSVTFSPDGQWIAGGNTGAQVVIWDGATLDTVSEFDMGNDDQVYAVAFSPDGAWLAASGHESDPKGEATIRLWNTDTGDEGPAINYEDEVNSIAFSPDCSALATGDSSGNIVLWRIGK
jgi:WD40 repeat protein